MAIVPAKTLAMEDRHVEIEDGKTEVRNVLVLPADKKLLTHRSKTGDLEIDQTPIYISHYKWMGTAFVAVSAGRHHHQRADARTVVGARDADPDVARLHLVGGGLAGAASWPGSDCWRRTSTCPATSCCRRCCLSSGCSTSYRWIARHTSSFRRARSAGAGWRSAAAKPFSTPPAWSCRSNAPTCSATGFSVPAPATCSSAPPA